MKSGRVFIKTRSTPTSLPLKGQVTKDTTVEWPIARLFDQEQLSNNRACSWRIRDFDLPGQPVLIPTLRNLDTLGDQLRFKRRFTGTTRNYVYVTSCQQCPLLHIGETETSWRYIPVAHTIGCWLLGNTSRPQAMVRTIYLCPLFRAGFKTAIARRSMEARLIFRYQTLHSME